MKGVPNLVTLSLELEVRVLYLLHCVFLEICNKNFEKIGKQTYYNSRKDDLHVSLHHLHPSGSGIHLHHHRAGQVYPSRSGLYIHHQRAGQVDILVGLAFTSTIIELVR